MPALRAPTRDPVSGESRDTADSVSRLEKHSVAQQAEASVGLRRFSSTYSSTHSQAAKRSR